MAEENFILVVENLEKSFGDKKVIREVSFKVSQGDVFGFLGPNGSGKTTIIRMILQLIHADRGNVWVDGYNMKTDFLKAIRQVGAIVETPSFYEHMTARQNLQLIANLYPDITSERVDEVLSIIGLLHRADDKVKAYSLGMKQRLGIGRALLHRPKLVFLDEPTNGIDPQGVIDIRRMITQLAREHGITFFITTHQLHEVEQICNRVAILNKGSVIREGFVKELLNQGEDRVEVVTDDRDKALSVIDEAPYVSEFSPSDRGWQVIMEKGKTAALNEKLVSAGVRVQYLTPLRTSLEQYFIELTGEEGGGADVVSAGEK